ncbi:MAG: hypothetical protein K2M11_10740 [Paramuribaculum sp.]|nr:hypothetical protein [Paramuribaculum sp.]
MNHSEFKEKARRHQIHFKEKILGIPANRCPKRTLRWTDKNNVKHEREVEIESSLCDSDTKDNDGNYVIFYPGFRKAITDEIEKSTLPTKSQMVSNLLRSEHIPYNIFFPMLYDLDGATRVFNHILSSHTIKQINDIVIEYNPGGLADGTSFDVYVDYTTAEGNLGGIGIEVKYTEKEYPIKKGSKEWNETHDAGKIHLADNYRKPSFESCWFKEEYIEDSKDLNPNHVVANKFRQIWRNHILGASMLLDDTLAEFTSLTIYPEGNGHFQNTLPQYESILTDKGKATFKYFSYEELFSLMQDYMSEYKIPVLTDWISYLTQRYIVL